MSKPETLDQRVASWQEQLASAKTFDELEMLRARWGLELSLRGPPVGIDDGTRELWLPRRAPNLNDLIRVKAGHNQAYNALKKSWAVTVAVIARAAMTPRFERCSVHFELVEPDQRRDPDNIAAGAAKLILDGLVKAGVLEGDGWKHINGLSFSWRVGTPAGVRVVLTPSGGAQ